MFDVSEINVDLIFWNTEALYYYKIEGILKLETIWLFNLF